MGSLGPGEEYPHLHNTTITVIFGFGHCRGNDSKSEQRQTDRAKPEGEEKVTVKLMGFSVLHFTSGERSLPLDRVYYTQLRAVKGVCTSLFPTQYSVTCRHSSWMQP